MGCDIHLYAEKKVKPPFWQFWKSSKWTSIDKYTKNADFGGEGEREFVIEYENRFYTDGRNYNLFCALAGVRSSRFYGHPPMVHEPKGVPDDCCEEIKKEVAHWEGDGHTHSWLTLKELKDFDWSTYSPTTNRFLEEVIPKMESSSRDPNDVRIVFFFDN